MRKMDESDNVETKAVAGPSIMSKIKNCIFPERKQDQDQKQLDKQPPVYTLTDQGEEKGASPNFKELYRLARQKEKQEKEARKDKLMEQTFSDLSKCIGQKLLTGKKYVQCVIDKEVFKNHELWQSADDFISKEVESAGLVRKSRPMLGLDGNYWATNSWQESDVWVCMTEEEEEDSLLATMYCDPDDLAPKQDPEYFRRTYHSRFKK